MLDEASAATWYKEQSLGYNDLVKYLDEHEAFNNENASWVFRGQLAEKEQKCKQKKRIELATSLERGCNKSGIELNEAHKVEQMMVREFRRVYDGEDRQDVLKDTLYCLSLLRHYGAPTRLLDFTYSRNIALYVGLKEAYNRIEDGEEEASFALWCIDSKDMNARAKTCCSKNNLQEAFDDRADIDKRNDKSFHRLYTDSNLKMVISEKPARIHKRLHLQQGILMCPANVHISFMDNLGSLYDKSGEVTVIRLVCTLSKKTLQDEFELVGKMNITEESLFPGLDGLAGSMNYRMGFLKKLWEKVDDVGGWPKT